MASLNIDGFAEMNLTFEELANIPQDVQDEMLVAGAKVVVRAKKQTAQTMLKGPYSKNVIANSIAARKPMKTKDGRKIEVEFKGNRGKERIAAIAYINEYGKKNQPARPFIQTAVESCAEEAVSEQEKIYDNFINKITR